MNPSDEIEQQLLRLLRRTQAIHVRTSSGDVLLERSSYGILCLILDEGPQRLGTIAQTFTLDPSTITRQVQAVVNLGLAEKSVDPRDRRASLLSLTEEGRAAIEEVRSFRRERLRLVLESWDEDQQADFAVALKRFNTTVEEWLAQQPHPAIPESS